MIKKNRLWAFILMMSMLVGLMPNIVYAAKWQYLETPPEFQNILFQSTGNGGEGVSGAREAGQQVAHPRLSGDDRQLPADDVLHHRVRLDAVLLLPDGQRPICRCDQ